MTAEIRFICKAAILVISEGDAPDRIVGGPEHSTLSNDTLPTPEFGFTLSSPPFGRSWKKDPERKGGKNEMRELRWFQRH